jgi:hypothetical protein
MGRLNLIIYSNFKLRRDAGQFLEMYDGQTFNQGVVGSIPTALTKLNKGTAPVDL